MPRRWCEDLPIRRQGAKEPNQVQELQAEDKVGQRLGQERDQLVPETEMARVARAFMG